MYVISVIYANSTLLALILIKNEVEKMKSFIYYFKIIIIIISTVYDNLYFSYLHF